MTHLPMERIEVPIGLIAQLSYYQESKVSVDLREKNVFVVLFSCTKDD